MTTDVCDGGTVGIINVLFMLSLSIVSLRRTHVMTNQNRTLERNRKNTMDYLVIEVVRP